MKAAPLRWRYLLQEATLFLGLSYVVLVGGTLNGLVLYRLNATTTVLIALGGALWLIWRWRRRRPFPATALDGPLLALLAAYVVASAFSVDPRRSFGATVLLALYLLIYYIAVDLLRAGWPAGLFVKAMLFAGSFILFFGGWELERWFSGWWAISATLLPPATLRLRALLGHPNFVAAFFALLLPLALTTRLGTRSTFTRWLAGLWCFMVAVLVFFTSSRSGWLGLGAALAMLALLWLGDRPGAGRAALSLLWQRWRRRPALFAASWLVLSVVAAAGGYVLYLQAQHPSHAGRDYIWEVALAMLRRHPLTGAGPFTYGTAFVATYAVPPDVLLAHAHNYYINTTAEAGLLGGLALLAVLAAAVRLAGRRWRQTPVGQRLRLAGYLAALAGLAVTSLFDTPQTFPALVVLAVLLAALIAAEDVPARAARWAAVGSGLLLVGWVAVVGALGWSLRAYAPFARGVLAGNLGDWVNAAGELDTATALDPTEAFYWLQAGFAHGRLALAADGTVRDPAALTAALRAYAQGVALEPEFSTNWANLAVLTWANGDRAGGLAAMERAVAGAPTAPAFVATLARLYEVAGQPEAAAQYFRGALDLRPDWATAYFFRATPLRQRVLEAWQQANPLGWQPDGGVSNGWQALQQQDYPQAVTIFSQARATNAPEIYLGLGLAELGQHDYAGAEQALRTALFVPGANGQATARMHLALGQALAGKGDPAAATAEYQAGLDLLAATSSFGVGQLGQSDYGWYIFNRESLVDDWLPGMDAVHYDTEAVAAMLALGDGATGEAAHAWYCRASAAAPDSAEAAARLAGQAACGAAALTP